MFNLTVDDKTVNLVVILYGILAVLFVDIYCTLISA